MCQLKKKLKNGTCFDLPALQFIGLLIALIRQL